jgi:hypothetical protein
MGTDREIKWELFLNLMSGTDKKQLFTPDGQSIKQ